jgi:Asp-tRNA(Asn)/Glu-tRNA(Gln) amidotransferase C subunit
LCKALSKNCGAKGQLLLNYDVTFLVVLLTGLYEPKEESREFVCALHPFRKRAISENSITEYAADMNVMLAYFNMVDDWKDERQVAKKAMADRLRKDYMRLSGKYPRQSGAIENYIRKLSGYEEANETNIDLVAGLTGEVLGELFAWKQDEWYDELKTMGYYLGKFIYLMDAYEDLNKDEKRDAYNPLRALKKEHENDFEVIVKLMMTSMMSECAKSFERLPIITHADILRNILYSGVWSKYEYIQMKKKKREKA